MKRSIYALSLFIGCVALTSNALAGNTPGGGKDQDSSSEDKRRAELTYQIVKKWAPHVKEAYSIPVKQWASEMVPLFLQSPMTSMQNAADARTFEAMNNVLLNAPTGVGYKPAGTKTLGEVANDLVFVPITPCRIIDTRLAGGQMTGNSVRHFDAAAVSDYSFQGGDASNCGGAGDAGSFAAAAINFTVVNPTVAGSGFLTAYPFLGTQPLAATMTFKGGQVLSNLSIVRLDQGASASEISVYSSHLTHLVGDLVGYFINPEITALDCVETAVVSIPVAGGAQGNATSNACAAGYTQTATNCESASWNMPMVYIRNGICSAQNNSSSSANLRASRTCCRIPGR